jgi:hypothetical protein
LDPAGRMFGNLLYIETKIETWRFA